MAIDPFEGIRTESTGTKIVEPGEHNALDKDAFLKIFLAQLEAQDPLNPQDSTQLSSQLAQFSQLEQSVLGTQALTQIGEKLDDLIAKTGGTAGVDPVSLIGRQIDFPADELSPSGSGTTATLQIPVDASPARSGLLVEVQDVGNGQRGLLSLSMLRDPKTGLPAKLPPGDYSLRFDGTTPQLGGPGVGSDKVEISSFQRLSKNEAGEYVLDPEPYRFFAGQRYRFTVRAVDAAGGEPAEIDLSRSAEVTSVRIKDGKAVAVADGVEVDPTRIHSIR
jgi:flagellar basal-body rod modification protein FlgD